MNHSDIWTKWHNRDVIDTNKLKYRSPIEEYQWLMSNKLKIKQSDYFGS